MQEENRKKLYVYYMELKLIRKEVDQMLNKEFFFCYNKQLFTFLHDIKGIDYITIAKNPTTDKTFSLFCKSESLQNALNDYKSN